MRNGRSLNPSMQLVAKTSARSSRSIRQKTSLYIPWMFMISPTSSWSKLPKTISNHVKPMSAFQPYHPSLPLVAASFPAHKSEVKWQAGRHSFKSNADLQSFQRRYEVPMEQEKQHIFRWQGCVCWNIMRVMMSNAVWLLFVLSITSRI